jgi:alpha-beta hydrolase superfamily lysophospholipase
MFTSPPETHPTLHAEPITWQETTFSFQSTVDASQTVQGAIWLRPTNSTNPITGKVLVFIPGLGGSVTCAKPVLNPLITTVDAIISVDCRGFGCNKHLPLTDIAQIWADLTTFTNTVLPTLQTQHHLTDATMILAGISLGGLLATYLAHAFPQVYQRLVLLVPAYKPSMAVFPLNWVIPNLLKLALTPNKQTLSVWLPYGVEAITRNPDYLNGTLPAPEVPLHLSMNFLKTIKDWQGKRLQQLIKQLQQPVFMCVAEQDKVSDTPALKAYFNHFPQHKEHRLLSLPDAYHDVTLEPEAPWIAQAITDWVIHPETNIATNMAPVTFNQKSFT